MGAASENVFKKYIYTPPPPSELIDSTMYFIDFGNRKFLNIGLDPVQNYNVTVQIITASRYISLSPDSIRRIYSLMANILSVILDSSMKKQKKIFHVDETIKLSKIVYREQNMLVVESQTQSGCRVLLSASDLIKIQNLEWCIFESIIRKSIISKTQVHRQLTDVTNIVKQEITQNHNMNKIKSIIKNIQEEKLLGYKSRLEPCHISQLKLLAYNQIAESCVKSSPSPSGYLVPKVEAVDENDGPLIFDVYSLPKPAPRHSTINPQSEPHWSSYLSPPMETTLRSKSEPSTSPPSLPPSPPTYSADYLLLSYPQECEDLRGLDENEELQIYYFHHGPPTPIPLSPPSTMSYFTDSAVQFNFFF